jgi:arginine exporter protein ArgO
MEALNNLNSLIDFKLSILGVSYLILSSLNVEFALKIIGSVFFIGYTLRRWYLMEKDNKNNNLKF